MQCCGDPFSVGSAIEWTVSEEVDADFLASFLSAEDAERFTHAEEHHADEGTTLQPLKGVVRGIDAVFCSYTPRPAGRTLVPATGSGLMVRRESADGWETEERSLRFLGYGVDVDPTDDRN